MWGSVVVLALLMALNPVRLALILLVISRPRPLQNLLAFWVGCLVEGFPAMLVPLMVLHGTPMLKSFADDFGKSPLVRDAQVGLGVAMLSIAALVTARSLMRRRQPAQLPTPRGNTSTLVLDSNKPTAISRLIGHAEDAATEGGSAVRRLLGRAYNAWENGSLWVAFVIGLLSGPAPDESLYVLAIMVASGAAIGTQVSAAIAFVVTMLVVVEITLASYLTKPTKTQAVVQLLHDWALAHRPQILVTLCVVGGVSLMANGLGGA